MDCMDPAARVALEITGTKCPQSMSAEERRNNYGPDASAEGSYIPPDAQTSSGRKAATATSVVDAPQSTSLYPN